MPATYITDPILVTDHSHWDMLIKPQELIDGGVTDVILKAGSGLTIDARFHNHGAAVAKYSQYLRLHAYWWDDPLVSGNLQADYAQTVLKKSGLPVLSLWADMEQWWSNWNKWLSARAGKLAWSSVPVFKPSSLESHCRSFAEAIAKIWPVTGIYTGRGFITTYAPGMKNWLGNYKVWFAAYGRQPATPTKLSWRDLRENWLPNYDPIIKDTGVVKENLVGHQFTGDRCLLPGSYGDALGLKRKALDVSVFQRSFMEHLGEVSSGEPVLPLPAPAPSGTAFIFLGSHLWVRNVPSETNARLIDSLSKDQRVVVLEIQGEWARLENPAGWVRLNWLTRL